MSALLIKNMPPPLRDRLRQCAAVHHRSMNREVIAILERELGRSTPAEAPPPVVTLDRPVSGEWIVQIIRDARDGKR
jgi:plasmid stability protein